MKINEPYSESAYLEAAIIEKEKELIEKGYTIVKGQKEYDLMATKDKEMFIFEFKYRKSNDERNREQFRRFIEYAKRLGAEPVVVYLSEPTRVEADFEGLDEIILNYLINEGVDEIDCLSTHSRIEEIYIERLTLVNINLNQIYIEGDANISVSLQYGSDRDNRDEEEDYGDSFPMAFKLTMNWEKEILLFERDINVDSFYD